MVILTCSNIDIATDKYTDEYGKWYRNFSFKRVIQETVKQAERCGYKPVVYDLGNLGMGERFSIADQTFAEKGYYAVQVQEGYKSRSLFKPEVVRYCLATHGDFTVYLDGDAQLVDGIDEVMTGDYDIGATLRRPSELQEEWHQKYFEIARYVNAGVIFFNPSPATDSFVMAWEQRTQEVGNDQKALNQLVCPEDYPEPYSIHTINGVRVKFFPCERYNYYYFDEGFWSGIKIMHFKGLYRHYFPFDWKKRLYCTAVVPVKNAVGPLVRRVFPRSGR